jgi:acyl-CoA synthetase (AMP-forming)/AMP-acid ligase II
MNHLHLEDNANRHLGAILERQAEVLGDSVFLMQDERRVTFGEANRIVNSIAHGLRTLGVGAGDRVAFFAYNAIEVVFVALAANKLGAAWVPINTDYKGEWLRDTVEASAAKVVLADDDLLPRLKSALGDAPDQQVVLLGDAPGPQWTRPFATLLDNPSGNPDLSGIDYGDVSAILWTSGTTGKSKGVMQSHNVWICNIPTTAVPVTSSIAHYRCTIRRRGARASCVRSCTGSPAPSIRPSRCRGSGIGFAITARRRPSPSVRCTSSCGSSRQCRTTVTIRYAPLAWCRCPRTSSNLFASVSESSAYTRDSGRARP